MRVRARSAQDGFPAIGNEGVVEVHHAGEWIRVPVYSIDIRIRADAIVTAALTVELAEVDLDAWPESLRRLPEPKQGDGIGGKP